ncbi:MAG TPA: hypothetical protein VJN71_04055 [Nitrososphaerales archaeon]|nr:hypothetical protein [Nitrososphaerales archaeon]
MFEEPYISREDSMLLRRALEGMSGESILEIGIGSGSNLISVSSRFSVTVGTDLQKTFGFQALDYPNIEVVRTDRAKCFKDQSFDVVAMNPPYLPSNGIEDNAIDGGETGIEVPLLFLEEAQRVAKKEGKIAIVLSSESDLNRFRTYCAEKKLIVDIIAKRELFAEVLYVFELRFVSKSFVK